jgi:hypothetical protein
MEAQYKFIRGREKSASLKVYADVTPVGTEFINFNLYEHHYAGNPGLYRNSVTMSKGEALDLAINLLKRSR